MWKSCSVCVIALFNKMSFVYTNLFRYTGLDNFRRRNYPTPSSRWDSSQCEFSTLTMFWFIQRMKLISLSWQNSHFPTMDRISVCHTHLLSLALISSTISQATLASLLCGPNILEAPNASVIASLASPLSRLREVPKRALKGWMNAEAVEEDRRAAVAVTRMVYFIIMQV